MTVKLTPIALLLASSLLFATQAQAQYVGNNKPLQHQVEGWVTVNEATGKIQIERTTATGKITYGLLNNDGEVGTVLKRLARMRVPTMLWTQGMQSSVYAVVKGKVYERGGVGMVLAKELASPTVCELKGRISALEGGDVITDTYGTVQNGDHKAELPREPEQFVLTTEDKTILLLGAAKELLRGNMVGTQVTLRVYMAKDRVALVDALMAAPTVGKGKPYNGGALLPVIGRSTPDFAGEHDRFVTVETQMGPRPMKLADLALVEARLDDADPDAGPDVYVTYLDRRYFLDHDEESDRLWYRDPISGQFLPDQVSTKTGKLITQEESRAMDANMIALERQLAKVKKQRETILRQSEGLLKIGK